MSRKRPAKKGGGNADRQRTENQELARSPEQIKFLLKIIDCLSGTYNSEGILRWLCRKRKQLGGKAPIEMFVGNWKPEDPGPQKVLELAKSLRGGYTT